MRDSDLFETAVKRYFEPIAQDLNLPLIKIRDGIYEMPSPYFVMRVRLHDGHARGLNVILREASLRNFNESEPGIQYSIGCFMLFSGVQLDQTYIDVVTDEDFLRQALLLAQAVKRFGVSYLLGQKNDFEAIKEMMRKRGEPELERIKQLLQNMPPFVRQEWISKADDD
jgi:hypothetical protein